MIETPAYNRVKTELENLDDKIDTVEDKLIQDIEDNANKIDEDISTSNEKHSQESKMLKELIEENERRLKQVETNLLKQKEVLKNKEKSFICDECGKCFAGNSDRRLHIKQDHPKHFSCDLCDISFNESWRYELHLETHSNSKGKKCEECGKNFFMEWRLRQHMNVHNNPNIRHCHYYNNGKECIFEPVGCKFKHIKSEQCSKPTGCNVKLCPKQHLVI